MKCVVVPDYKQYKEERWGAADLKLSSLQNFSALHLERLQQIIILKYVVRIQVIHFVHRKGIDQVILHTSCYLLLIT